MATTLTGRPVIYIYAVTMLLACRDDNPSAEAGTSSTTSSDEAPAIAASATAPPEFCTAIPPVAVGATATHLSIDTTAVIVDDLALFGPDRLYVLDSGDRQVIGLTTDGTEFARWGRDGKGPGEFENPKSLDVTQSGDVYVLDSRHVDIFDRSGILQRSAWIPISAMSIAITPSGVIALANWIYGGRDQALPYVVLVNEKTNARQNLLSYTADMLGQRPFIAPVHNKLSVTTGADGRVAAWFYYDPTIYVFRDGQLQFKIEGCLAPGVQEAYHRQAELTGRRSQQVFAQLAGVWLSSDGDIYTATANNFDRKGIIQRYDATGRPVAAYEFNYPAGTRLRRFVEFWNDPGVLVSWEGLGAGSGVVDVWRVKVP